MFSASLDSRCASDSLGFHDFQTHVAGGTRNGTHRGFQIGGIEIDKLDFRDLLDLLFGDLADLVAIRLRRTFGNSRSAQKQARRWRSFEDEREGAVRVNGDQHRKNHSIGFFLRFCIELLAEIHDVDAMGTKRGAHRRRWCSLTRCQLQLDGCLYLFWRHIPFTSIPFLKFQSCQAMPGPKPQTTYRSNQLNFSTLAKSSSTGVERPKMVTETFNRLWSLSISSTVPLKFANGPSTMRTCSLRSYTTLGLGRSCGVCTRLMIASTSASESGEGEVAEPTKPVTRGVLRTMCQVFSSRSISTKT